MGRLMLETVGTNVRLLSSIGRVAPDRSLETMAGEITRVLALAYWKNAISSAGHPVYFANSGNELLFRGVLVDFVQGRYGAPRESLGREICALRQTLTGRQVQALDDHWAAEVVRKRLLRNESRPGIIRALKGKISNPSLQLEKWVKRAKYTWVEIDDLQYTTRVHDQLDYELLATAYLVVCVPLVYGADLRYARSAIELAIHKIRDRRQPAGRLAEIMVIVTGQKSIADLDAFRIKVIADLKTYVEVPAGIFLASVLLPQTLFSSSPDLIRCEALVRYDHWLENHDWSPKLVWVLPDIRYGWLTYWSSRLRRARFLQVE